MYLRSKFFLYSISTARDKCFFVLQNFAIRFNGFDQIEEKKKRKKTPKAKYNNHFKMKIKIKSYNNFNDMGMIRMNRLFGTLWAFEACFVKKYWSLNEVINSKLMRNWSRNPKKIEVWKKIRHEQHWNGDRSKQRIHTHECATVIDNNQRVFLTALKWTLHQKWNKN